MTQLFRMHSLEERLRGNFIVAAIERDIIVLRRTNLGAQKSVGLETCIKEHLNNRIPKIEKTSERQ